MRKRNKSVAEKLIEIARIPRQRIVEITLEEPLKDHHLARFKLAIDFTKRTDLVFRALMENWDQERIVREVY